MRTRFRATAMIAGFGLLATIGGALASPAQVTQNTSVLNGDGGVIGSIAAGTSVDMEYCANGNCYVNGNGLRGWVPQGMLAATQAPQPQPQPQPPPHQQPGGGGGYNPGGNGHNNQGGNGHNYNPGGGGGGNNNSPSFGFDLNFGNNPPPHYNPPPRNNPPPRYNSPSRDDDAQVCFYDQPNFRGRSFCVGEGDAEDRLSSNWNDRISSIQVDDGLTVEVCRDNNLRGTCADIDHDVSRLPSSLNARISSFEVN